jgi:DNA gyrase subunit A
VLAVTEQGQLHFLSVLDIPESARASRGQSVYSLLGGADRSDRIVAMLPVDDLEEADRWVVFLSENGIMKRTELTEFSNPRAGGIIAAGVKEGDRILDAALSDGTAEIMLLTRDGRAIRFPETDISVMGRTAQGVKGIDLRGDDRVVGMLLIRREAGVLTVSEDGTAKRTSVAEFPLQKRGGLGTLATPSSGSPRPLVAALEVLEGDHVMLVTAGGQVVRVAASDVPSQGRRAQGRRVIKVPAGDRVVEVTRAVGEKRERPGHQEDPPPTTSSPPGGEQVGARSDDTQLGFLE